MQNRTHQYMGDAPIEAIDLFKKDVLPCLKRVLSILKLRKVL